MLPQVSIIILNWNNWQDTIECLESIYQIKYPNYDVIVIDNKSENDSITKIKDYCAGKIDIKSDLVKYSVTKKPIEVEEHDVDELEKVSKSIQFSDNETSKKLIFIKAAKNFGFPGGCNIGIRYAYNSGSDFFLLLNSDTVVAPDFLTELIITAGSDNKIGILSSKILYYRYPDIIQPSKGKIYWWLGAITVDRLYNYKEENQYDQIDDPDYVIGTSFLIKKDLFQTIGYIDETFFFGHEEYDYCARARGSGYRVVYVPTSKVWHKGGASLATVKDYPAFNKYFQKQTGGRFGYKRFYYLFKKHLPPGLFILPFFLYILRTEFPIIELFRKVSRKDWKGIKDSIKMRFF